MANRAEARGRPSHLAAEQALMLDLEQRVRLVLTLDKHPGFVIDETDLRVIAFALRFTADRI